MNELGCIDLLRMQVALEGRASHRYLALALWAGREGYPGSQAFFVSASQEERTHMLQLLNFMNDYLDLHESVPALEAALFRPNGLFCAFQRALSLEVQVLNNLRSLTKESSEVGMPELPEFLAPFLREQIDSVSELQVVLRRLEKANGTPAALFLVDEAIGEMRLGV